MASPCKETNHEQDVLHLFKAISKGKAHLTRFMLAASGPTLLNCFNEEGRTPLMECCYIREEATRVSMVKCIRDAGADVNQKDECGRTALIHACLQRCNDVVRILIMHCQIIPDAEDNEGNTALIHSANTGNDVAVELLVRNFRRLGLQVDHFNKEGYAALHIAAKNGFLQCAKILATKGKATLTLKDKVSNMTPMEICLSEGYQKSEVEFLKPSVKFYKVAKLTTTMVKYRKKSSSGQDSIGSVASKISPVKTVEKEKKLKSKLSLLKKSKPQANSEAGTSEISISGAVAQSQQKSPGESKDQKSATEKLKGLPLLKDMAKRSGQQNYVNCSDKKSEVIRLLEAGIKKDGTVGSKRSPIVKRKTDGLLDMNKVPRPQKLATSNSMTSPFTEKDFCKSDEGDDLDDINNCSIATEMTDLDGDGRYTASDIPSIDETHNNPNRSSNTTVAAALKNNNNNNRSNNNKNRNTNRGLVQLKNEDDNGNDFMDVTEEESLDQSESYDYDYEYESVSDCTLPSLSPITQIEYTDNLSSCNDDAVISSSLSLSGGKLPITKCKSPSKNPRWDSTSPQTEIEYIHFDDDQTYRSQSGSATSRDMTYSGSGNSDGNSINCEEVKPDFDKFVTGHVFKLIDDGASDGSRKGDLQTAPTSKSQMKNNTSLSSSLGLENNRKNVGGVKLNSSIDNSVLGGRNSTSPETIIESLDDLSIPKEFDDKTKIDNEGMIEIIRFANDSVDSKARSVDLNESTT